MELSVKDIGKLMRKSLPFILILTVLSTAIGVLLSVFVLQKEYSASAMAIVSSTNSTYNSQDGQILTESQYDLNVRLVNSYRVLCKSKRILKQVISNLNLNLTEKKLSDMISVTSEENTEIIRISVMSESPTLACDITNNLMDVFKIEVKDIMKMDNVKVIDYADVPTAPVRPNFILNIMVSFFVGLFIGFIIAFLRYVLDDTIREDAQVTDILSIPVIGNIPKIA
jgi:capsular polysaccharide biosynthesis protein